MSTLKKLKAALNGVERCFIDATGVIDDKVNELNDGERLPPEMVETRRALAPIREHLDAAHEIAAALAKKPSGEDDQELSYSRTRRSSVLDKFDRAHIGRVNRIGKVVNRATPLPPAAKGGGAFTTASVLESELKRLRALW